MRESDLEGEFRRHIERLGGKCWKWVSPGKAGVTDRIVLMPGRIVLFVELKNPGEEPTLLQKSTHREMGRLGHTAHVIDSYAGMIRWISDLELLCARINSTSSEQSKSSGGYSLSH